MNKSRNQGLMYKLFLFTFATTSFTFFTNKIQEQEQNKKILDSLNAKPKIIKEIPEQDTLEIPKFKTYEELYDKKTVKKIDEFKNYLLKQRPEYSEYINELFYLPSMKLEPSIDSILNNLYPKSKEYKWSYENHLKYIEMNKLKEQSKEFYENHKEKLLEEYARTNVDPRVIIGHLANELFFGELPQYYKGRKVLFNWFNTAVSNYVYAGKKSWKQGQRDKNFAKEQTIYLLDLANDVWNITPEQLNAELSSYKMAHEDHQAIPKTYFKLFKEKYEEITPFEKTKTKDFSIHFVAEYLSHKDYGNWKSKYNGKDHTSVWSGNRKSSMRYNADKVYNRDIWTQIVPLFDFKTEEQLNEEIEQEKLAQAIQTHFELIKEPEYIPHPSALEKIMSQSQP